MRTSRARILVAALALWALQAPGSGSAQPPGASDASWVGGPPKARPDWVWRARMHYWGIEPKNTAQADAFLSWLERYGYNLVEIQPDLGRPIAASATDKRTYDPPVWAWDSSSSRNRPVRYFNRQAHVHGVRTFMQDNTWSIGAHDDAVGIPILPEWVPLSALDADEGPAFVPVAGRGHDPKYAVILWLCPVDDFVRSANEGSIPRTMADMGYDLLLNDWNFQGFGCAGDDFRTAFRADTGYDYPGAAVIASGTVESPVVRAWRDWSTGRALLRAAMGVRDRLKATGPERVLFAYNSRPTRGEHEAFAQLADMLGDEVSIRSSFYDWPWQLATLRYDAAIQRRYAVPVVALLYTDTLSENYFGWALAHLAGLRLWRAIPELNLLDVQYRSIFERARPAPADVAVLYSRQTFLRYSEWSPAGFTGPDAGPHPYEEAQYMGGSEGGYGWAGWARALGDRHHAYDVVLDGDLKTDRLTGYKAIVVDNAAALSDDQVANLREYVRSGGALIASYHASLYDETGARRPDYALADVCGVHYSRLRPPTWSWRLDAGQPGAYFSAALLAESASARDTQYSAEIATDAGAETLATYVGGDGGAETRPAIVLNSFGSGRCLFFAGYPGSRAFYRRPSLGRPDYESGFTFLDYSVPYYRHLLEESIGWAVTDPYLASDAPSDIQIGVLRCGTHAKQICVHVLNARGWHLEDGTHVSSVPGVDPFYGTGYPGPIYEDPFDYGRGYEVPFPEYSQPIHIRIRDVSLSSPNGVTPGDPEGSTATLDRQGGYTEITLPSLRKYTIIILQTSDSSVVAGASLPPSRRARHA